MVEIAVAARELVLAEAVIMKPSILLAAVVHQVVKQIGEIEIEREVEGQCLGLATVSTLLCIIPNTGGIRRKASCLGYVHTHT